MDDRVPRLRIGPYLFIRQLEPGRFADRWLAVHEHDDTTHVVHRFTLGHGRSDERRFVRALQTLAELDHPHILPVQQYSLGTRSGGNAWIITPYTGNQDGLLTLDLLLREKGGRMPPAEAERALQQVLGASCRAHDQGIAHGPMVLSDLLVDPRGSISVELYGLARALGLRAERDGAAQEVVRDEIRSVVEIGYLLVTGLPADEPRIPACRLVRRLDHRWDAWFDTGLDPAGGFGSAQESLGALPAAVRDVAGDVKASPVRTVLSRFARALRSR